MSPAPPTPMKMLADLLTNFNRSASDIASQFIRTNVNFLRSMDEGIPSLPSFAGSGASQLSLPTPRQIFKPFEMVTKMPSSVSYGSAVAEETREGRSVGF